ncbi:MULTISPECIES: GNAT family N-acetyltransferase [Bacillus]|uniref:GNAT family N-acetyltransferase n=1 Tax=Bacillus TaxID=1386 RepID=UPI00031EF723|nr:MULTISPECIES: GNAT family N-acetyltransferase [Bacillus]
MKNKLLIFHLEESDIKNRMDLLYDYHVQKNLNHLSMLFDENQIKNIHLQGISHQQDIKRHYIIKTSLEQIVGYCWITSIDWINRTCELSISILPKYRIGYGYLALIEMYEYLYKYLNMKTITNQILEENELLRTESSIKEFALKGKYDSYTNGKYRISYKWTQTLEQHLELESVKILKNEKIKNKLATVIG